MSDDLQARLDRAIEGERHAARSIMQGCALREDFPCTCSGALDRYAALVALRARISVLSALFGDTGPYAQGREAGRLLNEATAEAERLLSGEAG